MILNSTISLAATMLLASVSTSFAANSAVIIVPAQASQVDRFAGNELAKYLRLSLGWSVTISDSAPADTGVPVFWVGCLESKLFDLPGVPRLNNSKQSSLVSDGVYLHGDGHNIVLTGKGPRGGLNAVYVFLDKYVGCRWPEPGREYVPKLDKLKLDGIDLVHNPAFYYRGIAIHGRCGEKSFLDIADWLSKNRMNAFQVFCGHYNTLRPSVLADIEKRGLMPNIGGHSREYFYPSAKYFKEHPEYFALVDGKRVDDTQLCYSNHASIPEYAANVVAYLKKNPEIKMVGLWPSDGWGFCQCDKCKSRQTTDVILDYINDLATHIHEQAPGIKCEFLSYIDYTVPPENVKPEPYLVPTYCEYWSRTQYHPITENRYTNANCRNELESWVRKSNQVTLFSYYGDDCIKRFLYNPVEDVIVEDLKYYHKIGLAGHFVLLTNPESWWSNAPHMYAYTRAAWDGKITLGEIENDYYRSIYGSAAKAMIAHEKACKRLFETKLEHGVTVEKVIFDDVIPGFDLAKDAASRKQVDDAVKDVKKYLNEAESQSSDPFVIQRIRKLQSDADYVQKLYECISEVCAYKADKDEHRKATILADLEAVYSNEILSEDDKNGYKNGSNVLLTLVNGIIDTDVARSLSDINAFRMYKEHGVWRWKTEDIHPSSADKPKEVLIEVTDRIKSAGSYEVTWDYIRGADGMAITSTALCVMDQQDHQPDNLQTVTIDEHQGFTGSEDTNNVYHLDLKTYDPSKRYFIVGWVYDDRDNDTFGQVLLTAIKNK